MKKLKDRKIVVINQASNYLTVGFCNAFVEKFEDVCLITGKIHAQGEELSDLVKVKKIRPYKQVSAYKKLLNNIVTSLSILYLLHTEYKRHEVFFISQPSMGYLLNLLTSNRFSMLIWDVYPDTFKIMGMKENHLVYKSWSYLNKKSFKKAYKIFTIGDKMTELMTQYVDDNKLIIQPIWAIFQSNKKVPKESNPFVIANGFQNKFIVQYSGNIGLTHKVEALIDIAEYLKEDDNILFLIIGKGNRVPALKKIINDKDLNNCKFLPFQSDEMFPFSLSSADVGVVILDSVTSKGSVPSKSYNLMSYGIPSMYVASKDSELHNYSDKFKHGECFEEQEIKAAANFIKEIYQNKLKYQFYAENAVKASINFKRNNADNLVDKYIN